MLACFGQSIVERKRGRDEEILTEQTEQQVSTPRDPNAFLGSH